MSLPAKSAVINGYRSKEIRKYAHDVSHIPGTRKKTTKNNMQNDNMEMENYEVRDLGVAAFLLVITERDKNLQFIGSRRDYNRVYFQFTPIEIAKAYEKDYHFKTGPMVHAKDFFNAERQLKDIIFARE